MYNRNTEDNCKLIQEDNKRLLRRHNFEAKSKCHFERITTSVSVKALYRLIILFFRNKPCGESL